MSHRPLFLLAALLVVGAAACDKGAGTTDTGVAAAQPRSTVARADTVFVELTEWSIKLSRDTIPAGAMVFRVVNKAASPHEFEAENENEEFEAGEIQPGAHVDVKARLERGQYEIYCPLAGPEGAHAKRGMRTLLTVS